MGRIAQDTGVHVIANRPARRGKCVRFKTDLHLFPPLRTVDLTLPHRQYPDESQTINDCPCMNPAHVPDGASIALSMSGARCGSVAISAFSQSANSRTFR